VSTGDDAGDERSGAADRRAEARGPSLRVAEITPFPRGAGGARIGGLASAFALDESASGVCVSLDAQVPVGALLRVVLRGFDDVTVRDEIVRVAWCAPREHGRWALGAERVCDGPESRTGRPPGPATGELEVQHAARRSPVEVADVTPSDATGG